MKNWILFLSLLPVSCFGQMFDNTWILGYQTHTPDTTDPYGISVITFPSGMVKTTQNFVLDFNYNITDTSLSDSSGNVQSYSNGVHIGNAAWKIMENGAHITNAAEIQGEAVSQWVLALPFPGHPQKQVYFYENDSFTTALSVHASRLLYSLLDMSLEQGLGMVTDRNILLIEDTLAVGKITAVKHANGRDWWVIINEKNSNRFYRILLDPGGIRLLGSQSIGAAVINGVGQAVFTPDGAHYAIYGGISNTVGSYINLYDFDRCNGLLNNHRQFHFSSGNWGGAAFSPNSRYLYINYYIKAYQYDLEATDVWASRIQVAEYDGFLDPFNTTFFFMQLAPDGKIYSSCTNGVKSMHVIHNPDEAGLACQYQQHGLSLPTHNAFSVPNFPNFRLGPLDGSSCDTLGIDNLPIAWWRYEQDTLAPLSVAFHDLSYYEPATWLWDFGDGSPGSNERHPQHTFPAPGDYQVCLTVSNANASNMLCRLLHFTISATDNPDITERIQVSPNPFRDRLGVALSTSLRSPVFRLYDQMGRLMREERLTYGITEVETGSLPVGMYYWVVGAAGEVVKSGKVVKVEP